MFLNLPIFFRIKIINLIIYIEFYGKKNKFNILFKYTFLVLNSSSKFYFNKYTYLIIEVLFLVFSLFKKIFKIFKKIIIFINNNNNNKIFNEKYNKLT